MSKRITLEKFIERLNEVLGVESSDLSEKLAQTLAAITEQEEDEDKSLEGQDTQEKPSFTPEQAQALINELGITGVDPEEFRLGLEYESAKNPDLDVREVAKIVYDRLMNDDPIYYSKAMGVTDKADEIEEPQEEQLDVEIPDEVLEAFGHIPGPKKYDPINRLVFFVEDETIYVAPQDNPEARREVIDEELIRVLGFDKIETKGGQE